MAQIVREHGLSEATFYTWKSKYAGASVAEFTRLKHLEEENRKLKQMFAEAFFQVANVHKRFFYSIYHPAGHSLGEVAYDSARHIPVKRVI